MSLSLFPLKKQFSQEVLLDLLEKKKPYYVLSNLAKYNFATTNFDLWRGNYFHFSPNACKKLWGAIY
jgi:hypothetical protein